MALATSALAAAQTWSPLMDFSSSGTTTGPATPEPPLWMCMATAPLTLLVTLTQTWPELASTETVALPVRLASPLGTSFEPLRSAVKDSVAAKAAPPDISSAPAARAGMTAA